MNTADHGTLDGAYLPPTDEQRAAAARFCREHGAADVLEALGLVGE